MSLPGVRRLGAWRVALAAAFAAGADSLSGTNPASSAARLAAAQLGKQAEIDNGELGHALGIEANSVRRLQVRAGDEALVLAVRRRLALEQAVITACRVATVTSMAEAIARRKQGLTRVGKTVGSIA
jgi:hypothetical protein